MKSTTKLPKNSRSLHRIILLCCCMLSSFLLNAQTTDTVLGKKYYHPQRALSRIKTAGGIIPIHPAAFQAARFVVEPVIIKGLEKPGFIVSI